MPVACLQPVEKDRKWMKKQFMVQFPTLRSYNIFSDVGLFSELNQGDRKCKTRDCLIPFHFGHCFQSQ